MIGKGLLSAIYDLVTGIKSSTDDISGIETKIDTVDTVVDAIKLKTDAIPSNPLGTANIAVPTADSADNVDVVDVVGNKSDTTAGTSLVSIGKKIITAIGTIGDYINVPYVMGAITNTIMAYLQTGYYHVHGASFLYPDKAVPVTLTSAAASWAETGNIIEVIPANTIIKNFDLHWCSISSISAELDGVIDFYSGLAGAEVKIGSVDVVRTSNFARENAMPLQIPQQQANTRISAKFTDSTTSQRTVRVKLYGHVYGTSLT